MVTLSNAFMLAIPPHDRMYKRNDNICHLRSFIAGLSQHAEYPFRQRVQCGIFEDPEAQRTTLDFRRRHGARSSNEGPLHLESLHGSIYFFST